ncbi:TetR family transcriptional regulator [Tepidicaulis marinus]|uniref:TetR family transcriptional regulator n=2 Tax=Tepidicaulis marinus TaxID=1333998 RepID=A0A081B6G4_9HYPH|nr:TetR family transcriptional regulator [Tepidicaulis marinus]
MICPDEMREKIIAAAKQRFFHYGYAKTTMAELAGDCDMSPGNLYRYFPGKLDIAEEICRRASIQTAEELQRILEEPGLSARERLWRFLLQDLRSTFETLEEDPKIVDMAQIVTAERPSFHNEGLKRERDVIARILEMGVAAGEFRLKDPAAACAEFIQAATMRFSYPQLFSRLSLERLEFELEGVFKLITDGLACPIQAAAEEKARLAPQDA